MKIQINSIIKLLEIYVLRILIHVLHIFPIKENRIIITSYRGTQYACNPKYITETILKTVPGKYELIWAFQKPEKFKYLKDKGMKVLPPDINKSRSLFRVENDGVRFGLSALKGAGQAIIDEIIKEREQNGLFKDFPDFVSRCIDSLNSRVVEGLIFAGAFDEMGVNRAQLEQVYEELCTRAKAISKQKNSAQMSLFGDIIEDETLVVNYPDLPEYELNEKLSKEKEVLGVYVSGHPFEKYMHTIEGCNFDCSFMDDYVEDEDGTKTYSRITDGMRITMAGIVGSYRRTTTKRTGASMAFLSIEDVYGSLECVCFPAIYEKVKAFIGNDKIIKRSGKLEND